MNREREEIFVKTFIVADKRERYLTFLASEKKRRKFMARLYHVLETVPSRTAHIASRDNFAEKVGRTLRQKGAGKMCYVISPEEEWDGQEMPLGEMLEEVLRLDSVAILCCLPGKLAYYKAESEAYLLEVK